MVVDTELVAGAEGEAVGRSTESTTAIAVGHSTEVQIRGISERTKWTAVAIVVAVMGNDGDIRTAEAQPLRTLNMDRINHIVANEVMVSEVMVSGQTISSEAATSSR